MARSSAWNGGTTSTIEADNSAKGAVYKGMALGANASGPQIYAANFNAGTVDVFDGKFAAVKAAGGFTDATIPAGFAPFNVANLGGKLYVAYAKQDSAKHDDASGAGNGFVDIFDMDGNFQKRLISNGPLNSPWGMAIAPATFGAFGGALLVGNFGDGTINAFDASSGTQLGTLDDTSGKAIAIEGLWALQFGNGKNGGDVNTLYFTAGPGDEAHGLFGKSCATGSGDQHRKWREQFSGRGCSWRSGYHPRRFDRTVAIGSREVSSYGRAWNFAGRERVSHSMGRRRRSSMHRVRRRRCWFLMPWPAHKTRMSL